MIGLRDVAVVNRETYSKVVVERRFMLSATVVTFVAMILFIVAVAMPEWLVIVSGDTPSNDLLFRVANASYRFEVGIWGEWRFTYISGEVDRG